MTRGILGRALLCTGLLAVWALPAHAQAIGSIFGKVTDSSGAVLPGVNVSVAGTGLQTPLTSESPLVDLKKTITGAVFTAEVLEKIPTARDPWQIANMTPGVSLSGYNVGGSQSGQQLTPSVRGSTASVQWNLEGGSITDL